MASRSLNKVELIGNLTRDPELRYTPSGAAVCTIGLATNRYWTTEAGEKKEEVEFHRVVAWNKLAELCSQLLTKGRKIYVEGRLRTAAWTAQDGSQRTTTEVVIEDMILWTRDGRRVRRRRGCGRGGWRDRSRARDRHISYPGVSVNRNKAKCCPTKCEKKQMMIKQCRSLRKAKKK